MIRRIAIVWALAFAVMSCRMGKNTIRNDSEQQSVSCSNVKESSTVADDSVSERMVAVLDSIDLWLVPEAVTSDDEVMEYKPVRLKARRLAVAGTRTRSQTLQEQKVSSSESTASHSKEQRREEAAPSVNPMVNVAVAMLVLLLMAIALRWNK